MDASPLTNGLAAARAATRQPSLSGALAVDGDLVWTAAIGTADPLGGGGTPGPHTRYRVASITKTMTAVAVLVGVESGDIALDRPVGDWLPDAPASDASIRQFLSHTAGLPAEPVGPWWERAGGYDWDALVAMQLPRLSVPGTRFHYSNVGFAVLGHLVETLHGRPWDVVLNELLWSPLGMLDTASDPGADHAVGVAVHPDVDHLHPEPVADYRALSPAGSAWSTPSDLARFGSFLAGVGGGHDILHPETLALMRTPAAFTDVEGQPWTEAYGLGVRVDNVSGMRGYGHSGSVPGFTSDLRFDPHTGAAAAICGNATGRFGDAQWLLPAWPQDMEATDEGADDELEGEWFWGTLRHRLARVGALLVLTNADGEEHRFGRRDNTWVGVSGSYFHGEILRPMRHGAAVRQLDIGTFCFTRTPYDPVADLPGGTDPLGWRPWAG